MQAVQIDLPEAYVWKCPECGRITDRRVWHCMACGHHNFKNTDDCAGCGRELRGTTLARLSQRVPISSIGDAQVHHVAKDGEVAWEDDRNVAESGVIRSVGDATALDIGPIGIPESATPRARYMLVTPQMASEWLGRNLNNRNIRTPAVDQYKGDMIAGRWYPSIDGIGFDQQWCLINGQHRLRAVVDSATPGTFLVCWGLPDETRQALDNGRKRTRGDAAKFAGHTYWAEKAAVCNAIFGISRSWNGTLSTPLCLEMIEHYSSELDWACSITNTSSTNFKSLIAPVKAALLLAHMRHPAPIDEFAGRVWGGYGLEKDSPALRCVQYLKTIQSTIDSPKNRRVESPRDVVLKVLRCCYGHVRGEQMLVTPKACNEHIFRHFVPDRAALIP